MLLFRITIVLLFSVNVSFVQAQEPAPSELPHSRMNGSAISCLLVGETGLPLPGMLIIWPEEDSGQNRIYAATPMSAGGYGRQSGVQRSGTARLIVGAIAGVMAAALPVQRFINAYASYDSGANQYSRPAIHIQPNINRGSAWVSVQLRL